MAVRGDIWVDWDASPRVIWVEAPSTELTIQDLVDTCRNLEADVINMAYPYLISAAGKDTLAVGVVVGITATLQNAVVAFEDRAGPTFVRCTVRDGNLLAIDSLGDPLEPIMVTDYTQVKVILSASATIVGSSPADISEAVWTYGSRTLTEGIESATALVGYKAKTTSQDASDPAAGYIKWNQVTQNTATELYISAITDGGLDITLYLRSLPVGTSFYIQDKNDSGQYQRWTINSITDNTTWFTFGVAIALSLGGNFSNNEVCAAVINIQAAGGDTPTAAEIADAVWDEALGTHVVAGSTADKLRKGLTTGSFIALK